MESMKAADDECKRLIRALETKEVELKEEKEKSSRLVTGMCLWVMERGGPAILQIQLFRHAED